MHGSVRFAKLVHLLSTRSETMLVTLQRLRPNQFGSIGNEGFAYFLARGDVTFRSTPLKWRKRDILWLRSPQEFVAGELGAVFLQVQLDPEAARELSKSDLDHMTIHFGTPINVAIKLLREVSDPDRASSLISEGLRIELSAYLLRHADRSVIKTPDWLSACYRFIEQNVSEPLTLEMVAKHARVSPRKLSAAFPNTTGTSFRDCIRRKRLDHACRLLLTTKLSIREIAHRVGFADHAHMTRTFREVIGISPSEYRQSD